MTSLKFATSTLPNHLILKLLLLLVLVLLQTSATVIHPHIFISALSAQVSDGKKIEELEAVGGRSFLATTTNGSNKEEGGGAQRRRKKKRQLVLIIDVDNTLYEEKKKGIERQIIQNIHKFCQRHWNYTKEYCDQLHQEYGSTVEGIRHNLLFQKKHDNHSITNNNITTRDNLLIDTLHKFYQEVYDDVDVTPLLCSSGIHSSSSSNNTGYLHDEKGTKASFPLAQFLQALSCPVYLASNSPLYHVQRVISALGMHKCNFAGILTPDHHRSSTSTYFPTKSLPHTFYELLLRTYPLDQYKIILLDDSLYSLQKASQCGIDGILISHSSSDDLGDSNNSGTVGVTLQNALGYALQYYYRGDDDVDTNFSNGGSIIITASSSSSSSPTINKNETYTFSDLKYLHSKNEIDAESINEEVWYRLLKEISLLNLTNGGELHVVDSGCGLLSMLRFLLNGVVVEERCSGTSTSASRLDNNNSTISSNHHDLFRATVISWWQTRRRRKGHHGGGATTTTTTTATTKALPSFVESIPHLKEIHYYAYELNRKLLSPCQEILRNMGLVLLEKEEDERGNNNEYIFTGTIKNDNNGTIIVRVYLRFRDFTSDTVLHPIHLLIGCCFADLFNPEILSKEILRFTSTSSRSNKSMLVYLPLTHAGTTSFLPPSPLDDESNIPSDTIAFRLYSESLAKRHGQCVDATLLVDEMEKVGADLLMKRSSNWNIDPNKHSYLWETLLYFFGKCSSPEMILHRWNATGWMDRARKLRPSIYVSNVDLLFRLQHYTAADQIMKNISNNQCKHKTQTNETVKEIIFMSPQKVEVVEKQWKPLDQDDRNLGPDQVESKLLFCTHGFFLLLHMLITNRCPFLSSLC
jgi:FMN phosphatase YigB (HAD superfamily)